MVSAAGFLVEVSVGKSASEQVVIGQEGAVMAEGRVWDEKMLVVLIGYP